MIADADQPAALRDPGGAELPIRAPRPAVAAPVGRGPFERARHALVEWLAHMIVVAGLLLGFHAIDALRHVLARYDQSFFAGSLLASVFDAGDAGLIIGFLVYGVYSVLNAHAAEAGAELPDATGTDRHGGIAASARLAVRRSLRPGPASFTIGSFAVRLVDHFAVYTVILAVSIYICLFIFAPWPVSVGSIGLLLLFGIASVAVSAPRGSFLGTLKWLVEIRIAVGAFVMALAVLLLIEEFLRRSS